MQEVTTIITSCGRHDLLERTINSFNKFNTYLCEILIIEDSLSLLPYKNVIYNETNMGQVRSIDRIYSMVKTPYIFHCENDWEFCRGGFIEKSMAILEADPKIFTVWLRGLDDTNTHPVEMNPVYYIYDNETKQKVTDYYLMAMGALGGNWDGFTWNPGLRRLSDYELVKPFSQYIMPGDFNALTECRIGKEYTKLGFRAAILPDKYVKHIG